MQSGRGYILQRPVQSSSAADSPNGRNILRLAEVAVVEVIPLLGSARFG